MASDPSDRSFETIHLQNQLGITAGVSRSDERGELMARANAAQADIGSFIQKDALPDHLREAVYVGSAAVHIYMFPTLGQATFVTQTDSLRDTPERLASDAYQELKREALRQLEGDVMESFGRRRRQRRSGL